VKKSAPGCQTHACLKVGVDTHKVVEVEDQDEPAEWLARHHEDLFEQELNGWYTDPALWPRDRSLKMLQEWCSFELHTVVVDTGASPLEDDELEE
jgi:hypothetical protein